MSNLEWRKVDELRLTSARIQDPNSISNEQQYVTNVQVAYEGAFLHIDARKTNEPQMPAATEYTVQVVPASAVEVIRYREEIKPDYDVLDSVF